MSILQYIYEGDITVKRAKPIPWVCLITVITIFFLTTCGNNSGGTVEWIVGTWVRTNAYAPHSDVHDLQSTGNYTFYNEYAQTTPITGSTWSSDGIELVLNLMGIFPVTYQVAKISDNQLELDLSGEVGYFYRKGTEPNGSIFSSGSTTLSLDTPENGTINPGDMKLYSIVLDENVYVLSWNYSGGYIDLTVYHQDQSTIFIDYDDSEPIEELLSSPVRFETATTETVYIVVEGGAVNESGDFSLTIQYD